MCTYVTETARISGSAKVPHGSWQGLSRANVYFDHPAHTMESHTLNIDLTGPTAAPDERIAIELTVQSARALIEMIEEVLPR